MKTTTIATPAATTPADRAFDLDRANTALKTLRLNLEQRQIWLNGQLLGLQMIFDSLDSSPPADLSQAQGLFDAAAYALENFGHDIDLITEAQAHLTRAA